MRSRVEAAMLAVRGSRGNTIKYMHLLRFASPGCRENFVFVLHFAGYKCSTEVHR